MEDKKWDYLEQFLLESFCEGQISRELRLSVEERDHIKLCYPSMSVLPLGHQDATKSWYLVTVSRM